MGVRLASLSRPDHAEGAGEVRPSAMDRRIVLILAVLGILTAVVMRFCGGSSARTESVAALDAHENTATQESNELESIATGPARTQVAPSDEERAKLEAFLLNRSQATAPAPAALGTGAIFGRVRDPSGRGPRVRGGKMVATNGFETAPTVEIDENGDYSVPNLRRSTWRVSCEVPGYQLTTYTITLSEEGARERHDFDLRGALNMVLRLQDPAGRTLFGVLSGAELELARTLRPVIVSTTATRGHPLPKSSTLLPNRAHGSNATDHWFDIEIKSYEPCSCCVLLGNLVLDVVPVPLVPQTIDLVVDPADLRAAAGGVEFVVVASESGEPLAGAKVALDQTFGRHLSVDSDARGHVVIRSVAAGAIQLSVTATDRVTLVRASSIRSGETTDLGQIRLEPAVSIAGRMSTPDGKGVRQGYTLWRLGDSPGEWTAVPRSEQGSGETDREGKFLIRGLTRDEYFICTVAPWEPPDPVDIRRGKAAGWAAVDARRGSVEGVQIVAVREDPLFDH